jgi:hypothetical protein
LGAKVAKGNFISDQGAKHRMCQPWFSAEETTEDITSHPVSEADVFTTTATGGAERLGQAKFLLLSFLFERQVLVFQRTATHTIQFKPMPIAQYYYFVPN